VVPLAGASFSSPFYASPAARDALDSVVGGSDTGNAVFVWRTDADYSCNCSEVDVRTRTAGGTFGPVVQVSTTNETGVVYSYPKIGVDGAGDAVAVWTSYVANSAIRARRMSHTGQLGPILTISQKPAAGSQVLIEMSKNGYAAFMWQGDDAQNQSRIYGRVLSPTGALSPLLTLSGPNSFLNESYTPRGRLAIDSQGDAVFVWKRQVNGPSSTQFLIEARALRRRRGQRDQAGRKRGRHVERSIRGRGSRRIRRHGRRRPHRVDAGGQGQLVSLIPQPLCRDRGAPDHERRCTRVDGPPHHERG
jgi:hypothetical protein